MPCIADTCSRDTAYTCSVCSGALCPQDTRLHKYDGRMYCPQHAAAIYGQQAGIVYSTALLPELVGPHGDDLGEDPGDLELVDPTDGVIFVARTRTVILPQPSMPHVDHWTGAIDPALDWAQRQERDEELDAVVSFHREAGQIDFPLAGAALGLASWAVGIEQPGAWLSSGSESEQLAVVQLPHELITILRDYPDAGKV